MKIVLPLLLVLSLSASAQPVSNSGTIAAGNDKKVFNAHTFGYVDGTRLDSVDAKYAEFTRRSFHKLSFDYGQSRDKRSDLLITDKEGKVLVFEPDNIAFVLNFFYFNGWELAHVYNATSGGVDTFILKRR